MIRYFHATPSIYSVQMYIYVSCLAAAASSVRAIAVIASIAAKALVSVTLTRKRTSVGASLGRRCNLATVRGALARTWRAISVVACEAAEARVVAAFSVRVGSASANL